ncbi:MAG: acetyltransferase [Balneolaceae bacterium]|nr:acetyltransferase [Balneolaceae bacterium]
MKESDEQLTQLAQEVQDACFEAAKEGFQEASISGLCRDGAIEAALGAIQSLDINKLIKQADV